jgi:ferritin
MPQNFEVKGLKYNNILSQGAFYSNAKTHRPAVAKFFLDSAIEERGHAKKLIEYLLMRGGDLTNITIGTIVKA